MGYKQPSPLLGTHAVVRACPSSAENSPLALPVTTLEPFVDDLSLPRARADGSSTPRKRCSSSGRVNKKKPLTEGSSTVCVPPPPARSTAQEPQGLRNLFSSVEITFQLDQAFNRTQQPRTTLSPYDLGNLVLWTVPLSVPIIESPRIFFVKNRSRVRDVVVVYVNGWSYDQMMATGIGLPRGAYRRNTMAAGDMAWRRRRSGQEASREEGDDSARGGAEASEEWNDRICSALLQPIRKGQCWARGTGSGGVQYAPLYIPHQGKALEQEIFWRNDNPRLPRNNGVGSGGHRPSRAPAPEDGVDERIVTPGAHEARGVGRMFRYAQEMESNATSPVTASPLLRTDAAPPATESVPSPVGVSEADGTSLWEDRQVLTTFALHAPEHHGALMGLGFVMTPPVVSTDGDHVVLESGWSQFGEATAATAEGRSQKTKPLPRVYAFDCEMVLVEGNVSALARATLVDVHTGHVAFDTLVQPTAPIVDYLTRFSGIEEEMLADVTTSLKDCQTMLQHYVGAHDFLVGHSLENDLKACKMLPTCYILDSAWLYPHPSGLPYKNALRFLAMRYLNRKIQQGSHDSTTDALVSAELVHLKMEKGPQFGVRERVSVLSLIASAAAGASNHAILPNGDGDAQETHGVTQPEGAATATPNPSGRSDSVVDVKIYLFDEAQNLTTIIPKHNAACISAVPVRHDEDACRKVCRALQGRQKQKEHAAASYSLFWTQFNETAVDVVVPPTGPDGLTAQEAAAYEALQLEKVWAVNNRVMRVLEACPDDTVVLVVAGDCRGEVAGNHLSRAQGAVFGMVKDHTAAGPTRPIPVGSTSTRNAAREGEAEPPSEERHAKTARVAAESVPTPPACQPQ